MNPYRLRRLVGRLFVYALLAAGAAIILVPVIFMVSTSLKPYEEVFFYPPRLFPSVPRWQNYLEAPRASYLPFWAFVRNSLVFCLPITALDVIVSTIVAFGFARIRFRGSRERFFILLATMMLPRQVTMIPIFIGYSKLGWINTYWPLIFPSFFGWPYAIFLIRQFFSTIPDALDDAARIDGCGWVQIFLRIHAPLAKPAMGIVAIFSFTANWADYLSPLLYLRNEKLWPLALALQTFLSAANRISRWHYAMVVGVLMCIPPLALFFVAQKQYIQGIVITGVKG